MRCWGGSEKSRWFQLDVSITACSDRLLEKSFALFALMIVWKLHLSLKGRFIVGRANLTRNPKTDA